MFENRKLHTYLFSHANVGKYNIGFQLKISRHRFESHMIHKIRNPLTDRSQNLRNHWTDSYVKYRSLTE